MEQVIKGTTEIVGAEKNVERITDATVTVSVTSELLDFVAGVPQLGMLWKKLSGETALHVEDMEALQAVLRPAEPLLMGKELDHAINQLIHQGHTFKPDGPYLHELLQGCHLNLPENPEVARNPELAARVDKLRHRQAEVAYQAMTKNVAAGKFHKEDTIAYQMDMMNRHLIAVGQLIISVGAGFAFGFLGIPLLVGGLEFGVRVLLGMSAAIVIAIAELYFLGKYMAAEDQTEDDKLRPATSNKKEQ